MVSLCEKMSNLFSLFKKDKYISIPDKDTELVDEYVHYNLQNCYYLNKLAKINRSDIKLCSIGYSSLKLKDISVKYEHIRQFTRSNTMLVLFLD